MFQSIGFRNARQTTVIVSLIALALLAVIATAVAWGITPARASAAGRSICAGTYLVEESGGVQSLWTFSRDRTLQITSSSEDVYGFSHQQGSWARDGSSGVKTVSLDFSVDGAAAPTTIARVDATLTFSDQCSLVAGSLDLRSFDATTKDPLDISSEPIILSDTFTGRKVDAKE